MKPSFIRQWVVLAAVLFSLGSQMGWNLYADYNAANSREQARLAAQAKVVDANLSRQLDASDRALNSIRSDLPYLSGQKDSGNRVKRRLQFMREAMPGTRAITLA